MPASGYLLRQLLVWFVLFNDTWSQYGYSVSCMIILFSNLHITRSDIRPHKKWAVNLVFASMVTSIFLWGVSIYGLTYPLMTPEGTSIIITYHHFQYRILTFISITNLSYFLIQVYFFEEGKSLEFCVVLTPGLRKDIRHQKKKEHGHNYPMLERPLYICEVMLPSNVSKLGTAAVLYV